MADKPPTISRSSRVQKRLFDIVGSVLGLVLIGWVILLAAIVARINTGENGIYSQIRIGRYGRPFRLLKIRTMRSSTANTTTVTTKNDPRITRVGKILRKLKIDEFPQLINVLAGHMSFVGPRPDVPGFADLLQGRDRAILSIRPGITGPASIHYRGEEAFLAEASDPEALNRDVMFPHKVQMNLEYIKNYTFLGDLKYILATIFGRSAC